VFTWSPKTEEMSSGNFEGLNAVQEFNIPFCKTEKFCLFLNASPGIFLSFIYFSDKIFI
jgi:hypothetical protein